MERGMYTYFKLRLLQKHHPIINDEIKLVLYIVAVFDNYNLTKKRTVAIENITNGPQIYPCVIEYYSQELKIFILTFIRQHHNLCNLHCRYANFKRQTKS